MAILKNTKGAQAARFAYIRYAYRMNVSASEIDSLRGAHKLPTNYLPVLGVAMSAMSFLMAATVFPRLTPNRPDLILLFAVSLIGGLLVVAFAIAILCVRVVVTVEGLRFEYGLFRRASYGWGEIEAIRGGLPKMPDVAPGAIVVVAGNGEHEYPCPAELGKSLRQLPGGDLHAVSQPFGERHN